MLIFNYAQIAFPEVEIHLITTTFGFHPQLIGGEHDAIAILMNFDTLG
jgi:hypothetical protein